VALIPGDISKQVEARLVGREAEWLSADLVLVPHHGSRGSSGPEFVHAVAPRWAVFSVGHGNRFGLPRDEVVQAWRDVGAQPLSTAEGGFLAFRLGPRGIRLLDARRTGRPRYWREPADTGSGYAIGTATGYR
jgi:competence protein ComEC